MSLGGRLINTSRCVKLRRLGIPSVLQPLTEQFTVWPPKGHTTELLSPTMKLSWRVMQYLSARVSFVICQMTEEAQEGVITGLAEIAFLFYSFLPPPSLSLTLFMILLVTVRGIGFRTLRSFLYFFITEMKWRHNLFQFAMSGSQWACHFCTLTAFSAHFLFFAFYVLPPSEFALK